MKRRRPSKETVSTASNSLLLLLTFYWLLLSVVAHDSQTMRSYILSKLGLEAPPTLEKKVLPVPSHIWSSYREAVQGKLQAHSIINFYPSELIEENAGLLLSYNLSLSAQDHVNEASATAHLTLKLRKKSQPVAADSLRVYLLSHKNQIDRLVAVTQIPLEVDTEWTIVNLSQAFFDQESLGNSRMTDVGPKLIECFFSELIEEYVLNLFINHDYAIAIKECGREKVRLLVVLPGWSELAESYETIFSTSLSKSASAPLVVKFMKQGGEKESMTARDESLKDLGEEKGSRTARQETLEDMRGEKGSRTARDESWEDLGAEGETRTAEFEFRNALGEEHESRAAEYESWEDLGGEGGSGNSGNEKRAKLWTDGVRSKRSPHEEKEKKNSRKQHRRKYAERGLCQRRPMQVDFEELKWQDWILAPKGYPAFECSGRCPHPLPDSLNASNHAVVQSLLHSLNPEIPPPCCVPTEMSSLTILYMDTKNRIVIKNYPDMIVEACGCR